MVGGEFCGVQGRDAVVDSRLKIGVCGEAVGGDVGGWDTELEPLDVNIRY